jgi:hypothetical protein
MRVWLHLPSTCTVKLVIRQRIEVGGTQSESSPTRYSYSSRSGESLTSDSYSWSEHDSIQDAAEVKVALSVLDNELDQTEDALTK